MSVIDLPIKYDSKYETPAMGFPNLGSTCYFNSLMQALLSCTSIVSTIDKYKNDEKFMDNKICKLLYELYLVLSNTSTHTHAEFINIYKKLWNLLINTSQNRIDNIKMSMGQQDAHEGLMMFYELIDKIPELRILFRHRNRIVIVCGMCSHVTHKEEINMSFEIQSEFKQEIKEVNDFEKTSMQLNDFIKTQHEYISDFKCPNKKCNDAGRKQRLTKLSMVPEILPIIFKKYNKKVMTAFPMKLEFKSADGKSKMIYQLVSQVEHSGTMMGGHYWCIVKRKNGWKNINDGSITNETPSPSHNTYILFYHYMWLEPV